MCIKTTTSLLAQPGLPFDSKEITSEGERQWVPIEMGPWYFFIYLLSCVATFYQHVSVFLPLQS